MTYSMLGAGLLFAAVVPGATCVAPAPPPLATALPQPSVSLHGYFGNKTFTTLLESFVLPSSAGSPLPSEWKGAIPLQSYQQDHLPWYIDKEVRSGQDDDDKYGLESSTLAFFAGHGETIRKWWVPAPGGKKTVSVKSIHLGDGSLTYFWLYACGVLAHGPMTIKDRPNYSAPQCFDPEDQKHADAFRDWAPAFGPNMRMVCGGSTSLGQRGVEAVWNYLFAVETSVADAWILGLAGPEEVPVCLARGKVDPASSALSDRTLKTDCITGPEKNWLHFQFPVECTLQPGALPLRFICNRPSPCDKPEEPPSSHRSPPEQEDLPPTVPLLLAAGQENSLSFHASGNAGQALPLGFRELAQEDNLNLKYHPAAGSFVWIKNRNKPDQFHEIGSCTAETQWTLRLPQSLTDVGLGAIASDVFEIASKGRGELMALEMRVESRPDDNSESPKCRARSLFVQIGRTVPIGSKSYPIFGPAMTFEFQRLRGAELELASFSTPQVDEPREQGFVTLKPVKKAIREAHAALQLDRKDYPIRNARATFGYERAPLQCQQEFLRPTYEIRFFPGRTAPPGHPIVTVRRDARKNPPEAWECPGWGDFPAPA